MKKFYTIKHIEDEGTPYASSIVSTKLIYHDNCPECKRPRFNEDNHDLSLVIDGKGDMPDYLLCGHYPLNIVSSRVIETWGKHGIIEYKAFPIKDLLDINRNKIISDINYFDIRITKSVELDLEKMGIKVLSQCSKCHTFEYNKQTWEFGTTFINENSYDGSDLFTIKHFNNIVVCSEEVLNVINQEKFTNFNFTPLESSFDPFHGIDTSFLEMMSITVFFDWNNPESKETYGKTFVDHGSHFPIPEMMTKAKNSGHQLGQWQDNQIAADFIAEIAQEKGAGVYDVTLPSSATESFPAIVYLATGFKHQADKARIIVKEDGSIDTAYPFSSKHPH